MLMVQSWGAAPRAGKGGLVGMRPKSLAMLLAGFWTMSRAAAKVSVGARLRVAGGFASVKSLAQLPSVPLVLTQ